MGDPEATPLRRAASPLLPLVLLAAGCVAPAVVEPALDAAPLLLDVDPTTPGPLGVVNESYDLGVMLATRGVLPPYPVRLLGALYHPEGGEGPFPLVVLLHGNHFTCHYGDLWPASLPLPYACGIAPDTRTEPSFAGYGYLATNLASHGYVVASIDANDVNEHNRADAVQFGIRERAELVLRTLEEIARLAKPGSGHALEGRVDLARIGLMGHSRGGEGVVEAAILNEARADPFALKAVIALAPSDFARRLLPPDVAFLTILPYCDGDMYAMHGAWMYDDARRHPQSSAPLVQALVMGANHNFYNEVWTYDDARIQDEDDPACQTGAPTRATPEQQRLGGLALMGAFLRRHAGDEPGFDALLEGALAPPTGACAPVAPACDAAFHLSTWPATEEGVILLRTETDDALATHALGGPVTLEGFADADVCEPSGARRLQERVLDQTPLPTGRENPCPTAPNVGSGNQLTLAWRQPGARLALAFPSEPVDATRFTWLSLRAGVDFQETDAPVDLRVTLRDADGTEATLDSRGATHALFVPPGETYRRIVLNEARLPLAGLEGVDLARLAAIEIAVAGPDQGRLQVTDVLLR